MPGIAGSLLLAASRAIGETMIVVMAAGLAANLTANPLDAVTTNHRANRGSADGRPRIRFGEDSVGVCAWGCCCLLATLILKLFQPAGGEKNIGKQYD